MAQSYDDKEDTTGGEYQFQEDQDTPEYKYEETTPTEKSAAPKKRSVVIGIGVLVIIFILYEVYRVIFLGPSKTDINEMPQPIPETTTVKASPTLTNTALPPQTFPAQSTAVVSDALSDKIDKMQADSQNALNNLEKQQFQTQTNMMTLQETVTGLADKLTQVSDSLQAVAEGEQSLQAQAQRAIDEKHRQQVALRKMKQYFVDAVIPGRAWLKGIDGSTITVTVGQKVPGYGTVTLIDPYSGVVRTTTGKIPYGTSGNP